MRPKPYLVPALFLACALPTASQASPILNFGFETGTTAGWSSGGIVSSQPSSFGVTPTQGTYQAVLHTTGNGSLLATAAFGLLGTSGSSVVGLGQGLPINGSVLYQTFNVAAAGDVLFFDWDFATDELNESAIFNDFAFFTIDGAPIFLGSRNASSFSLTSPPAGYDGQTGYATRSYTFATPGPHTLGFGAFNAGDIGHDSVLLIDNLKLPDARLPSPVPTPSAVTMGAVSLGLLVARRRR